MRPVRLKDSLSSVLCLGAHADDIEIGCGGTLLKLLESNINIAVYWVVFSANSVRRPEAEISAQRLTESNASEIFLMDFHDGFFPQERSVIKEFMVKLAAQINPDLIFTHYRNDAHQDHRSISELTWEVFRNNWILEYEIPKYDGDLGSPNVFFELDELEVVQKVRHIIQCFDSQSDKDWFQEETFRAMLRIRGMESRAHSGYAEGFYCRKVVFS